MTEDEAKTKWCCGGPMQFLAASTLHTGEAVLPDEGKCVASACMAWRWEGRDDGNAIATGRGHIPKHEADGHCGLAGKP